MESGRPRARSATPSRPGTSWADALVLPRGHDLAIGAAVAVQIATTAIGLAVDEPWGAVGARRRSGVVRVGRRPPAAAVHPAQRGARRRLPQQGRVRDRATTSVAEAGRSWWSYAAAVRDPWWLMALVAGRRLRLRAQRPALAACLPPGAGSRRCGGVDPLDRPRRSGSPWPASSSSSSSADGRPRPAPPGAGPLKLVTILTAVSEAEFAEVRDRLEVSDSVLSKHLSALGDRVRAGAQGRPPGSTHDVGGADRHAVARPSADHVAGAA